MFPTKHTGGEIVLRNEGQHWTFDYAAAVSTHDGPCISYVASHSKVEHEVGPVKSGHLVVLTYNLYDSPAQTSSIASSDTAQLAEQLTSLFNNPAILPNGGYVGFGLQREYAIRHGIPKSDQLEGIDAELLAFFEKHSYQAGLNLWFDASFNDYADFHGVLTDFIPIDENCAKIGYEENNNHEFIVEQGGRTVRNVFDEDLEPCEDDAAIDILWISTPTTSRHKATRVET